MVYVWFYLNFVLVNAAFKMKMYRFQVFEFSFGEIVLLLLKVTDIIIDLY